MIRPINKLVALIWLATSVLGLLLSANARAGSFSVWACGTWTVHAGVMHPIVGPGYGAGDVADCAKTGLALVTTGKERSGNQAAWQTTAPRGIALIGAWVPPFDLSASGINDGNGEGGGFYWKGGNKPVDKRTTTWKSHRFASPYFGWHIVCRRPTCYGKKHFASLLVFQVQLKAEENRAPTVSTATGTSLWTQHGWVRGEWPISFRAADPSGVCKTQALVGSETLNGPSSVPNSRSWHQCPDQGYTHWVNTADFVANGSGAVRLTLRAMNAAGVWTSGRVWSEVVRVDDISPLVTLSGPHDALSTAGTQYITATAAAGPSGVAGILCSVDASPPRWYAGSIARLAVSGIGPHRVSCVAMNRARGANGQPGVSRPSSWTLSIRQPTVSTISFTRVVNKLHCEKTRERVRIPAQWVFKTIHGHRKRVWVPAQTLKVSKTRCHPKVVKRRVWQHGHWVTKRIVELPRRVRERTKRIRFGATVKVSGWLGTARGTALAHQKVAVLTAPDNGQKRFRLATVATTHSDGSWSARLPRGPSRLVRAFYGGDATVEPSASTIAHLAVQGSVRMSLSPARTRWGHTIKITGRVRGGYIPPSGEVVVLRIGWKGGSTEIGHLYTARDGSFASTYTFLRGNGTETYHLWAATARESDYPFAPARSPSVQVTVHQ